MQHDHAVAYLNLKHFALGVELINNENFVFIIQ